MKQRFYIKEEIMCGEIYYMIYRRVFFIFGVFYERWNTDETAKIRLMELLN